MDMSAVKQSGRRHDHRPPDRHEPGAVHRRVGGAAARAPSAGGEHGERVGGAPPGVARPRGDRGGPELRADVCQSVAAQQDRHARCRHPDGRLRNGRLAARVSALGGATPWRAELAVRDALVRTRTRYIALAKALVRRDGLRVPTSASAWVPTRIAELELSPTLTTELAPLFAVFAPLNAQIAVADARMATFAKSDPIAMRLTTAPGVDAADRAVARQTHRGGRPRAPTRRDPVRDVAGWGAVRCAAATPASERRTDPRGVNDGGPCANRDD